MTTSPHERSAVASGAAVLVVGGRGFVGSHVVRDLVGRGYRVHVFGPGMKFDLLQDVRPSIGETIGSVVDMSIVEAVVRSIKPAAIVTCAAFGEGIFGLMRSGEGDADQAFAVNVDGFRHLIEIAAKVGVNRIVWTSSTVVYGPAALYGVGRVDEDAAKMPRTVYGLTKHLAEEVAAFVSVRHGIDIVGLRLPLVLGPGLWYNGAAASLMALLAAAREGRDHAIAFHDEAMDLMFVADTARAVAVALHTGSAGLRIYNINGFTARASDIVRSIGMQLPNLRITHAIEPAAVLFPLISDVAFRTAFGFAPAYDLDGFVAEMITASKG